MGYELKTDKLGNQYYSFIIYDSKTHKNIRLKKQDVRNRFGCDIKSLSEAIRINNLLKAEYNSAKERYLRKLEWQKKYYNFAGLLDEYTKRQKRKAPHGFKNNVHYLKYYVLPYFLDIVQNNNINGWHLEYRKFRNWLEDEAKLIRDPSKNISYSSKNHAVKALNTFMRHLHQEGIINQFHACEAFDESKLNTRTIDDVISEEESIKIYNDLIHNNYQNEAEFFLLLYWTGMRFNEGVGLSLADIYKGEITRESFKNLLRRNLIFYKDQNSLPNEYLHRYFGFITLSSQLDNTTNGTIIRNSNGEVKRKPLKMKKSINERNTRIIPIVHEELWSILSRRAKQAYQNWKNKTEITTDKSNYLLFEGINHSSSSKRLKEIFSKLKIPYKSWHCCRHSRGTYLHGKTGDKELGMKWLGHSSEKVYDKYVHTYEGLMREIKAKDCVWE